MSSDDATTDKLVVPGLDETTLADLIRMWTQQLVEAHRASPLGIRATMQSYLDVFVRGGGDAVKASIERGPWVQVSVSRPSDDASASRLLTRIRSLINALFAEELIENFFFMNKPPGLRLRFEATRAAPDVASRVKPDISAWRAEGLIDVEVCGVYEPEVQLFGGPRSIPHVHAIFTLDSLVWLEYQSQLAVRRYPDIDVWNLSFAVLRSLFDGLGIVGWEDLNAWKYVADRTGRRLPPSVAGWPDFANFESNVHATWDRATDWTNRVGHRLAEGSVLATCQDALRAAGARWKSAYFDQPDAWIGPRQAAAYVTIFHWNRAGFSAPQQALIAGALASRRSVEERYGDRAHGPTR